MDEHEKLERARQQVNVLLGFYIHLAVFVATMALLLVINFAVYYWANSVWWVQWPFLGWGIGLATHAFCVFRRPPTPASKRMQGLISAWEDRTIRKLMDE